jgi:pimeloyl-ACP methyl ester carboxylesterase
VRPSVRSGVALLLVLALALSLVGVAAYFVARSVGPSYDPVPITVPDDVPAATQAPEDSLTSFYEQRVVWRPCGADQCATMDVPLDYAQPQSETISLNLLRRPADDDDKVGSLLVNPGGPGAAGSGVASKARAYFGDALMRHFDIVGFDPRGTGRSDPVDCLSDADLDGYLSADSEPSTSEQARDYVREVRQFGRGCEQLSGRLASHISTVETARDMDVLRAVLGERVISYFGFSYGTELGATYAELFPERVGRFVLDGGVDPTLSVRDATLTQAEGFETALRAYVANCLEVTDSCFLGDSVDEGLGRIRGFLDALDSQPLDTSSGRPLTQALAITGIVAPLYSRGAWIILSQALKSAFDGDGSALLLMADQYSGRESDGSYASNIMEAFPAISCLDDPSGIKPSDVPAQYPAFEEASPTFGKAFAWSLIGCRNWPAARGLVRQPLVIDASGAAPIVVVGTTRDPATPLVESEALASQLESGVLVTRDGDGHTGYHSGNDCVDEAVDSYLVEGKVPRDGLTC